MLAKGSASGSSEIVVFAGRERGSYKRDGHIFPLGIRTLRIFTYVPVQGGWHQAHHNGSSDTAERLDYYDQVVLSP